MHFDNYSVALLLMRHDAPELSEEEADALQDAHMAHLANLHEAGQLLVAGPLFDDFYRGLTIFAVDVETTRRLLAADPAVIAGRFDVKVAHWMVPGGATHFTPTSFPRSMADTAE
jgi:hypothetical protein